MRLVGGKLGNAKKGRQTRVLVPILSGEALHDAIAHSDGMSQPLKKSALDRSHTLTKAGSEDVEKKLKPTLIPKKLHQSKITTVLLGDH
jgi:hypothetical protein